MPHILQDAGTGLAIGAFLALTISLLFKMFREDREADKVTASTPDDAFTDIDVEEVPADTVAVVIPITDIGLPEGDKPFRPSFLVAHKPVAVIEGGYQRHAKDSGNYNRDGELVGTNWGIAAPVAEDYFDRVVTTKDMKDLAPSVAHDIFRKKFWDQMKGNQFPTQELANIVYDGYVNHGRWGIRLLQRVLGLREDGILGPVTLKALLHADPDILYNAYFDARHRFYHSIVRNRPEQKVFLKGWMKRLNHYKQEEAAPAKLFTILQEYWRA